MFGLESDKFARGLALVAKHARNDAKADREYVARTKAASSNDLTVTELDDELAVPEARDALAPPPVTPRIQVPTWLPAPARQTASWFRRPMWDSWRSRQLRRQ
jgi:hypothetical protein